MKYREVAEDEAALRQIDKIYFVAALLIFVVSISFAAEIKQVNKFLPAIMVGISGVVTEILSYSTIIKNRRDKHDGLVHRSRLIPIMAYATLSVVTFLLFFITLLLFAATAKHGKVGL